MGRLAMKSFANVGGTMLSGLVALATAMTAVPAAASTVDSCRAFASKVFNVPSMRSPAAVTVVYVFDVAKADSRELGHILQPPRGSLENYHLDAGTGRQLLTYTSGRVGDIVWAIREIQEMCLREQDDGFRLTTVRVSGKGVDVKVGPDPAVLSDFRTLTVVGPTTETRITRTSKF